MSQQLDGGNQRVSPNKLLFKGQTSSFHLDELMIRENQDLLNSKVTPNQGELNHDLNKPMGNTLTQGKERNNIALVGSYKSTVSELPNPVLSPSPQKIAQNTTAHNYQQNLKKSQQQKPQLHIDTDLQSPNLQEPLGPIFDPENHPKEHINSITKKQPFQYAVAPAVSNIPSPDFENAAQHKFLTVTASSKKQIQYEDNNNQYFDEDLQYSEDAKPSKASVNFTPSSGGSKLVSIPKDGNFAGSEIVQIMKHHLRSKYEKYENYDENDLERSILSFLNEYVSEMKTKEEQQSPIVNMGDQSGKNQGGQHLIYSNEVVGQDHYNPNIFLNQPSESSDDRPDADVADFEYGQTTPRSLLNSTLDWNDPDKISKRIKRQIEIRQGGGYLRKNADPKREQDLQLDSVRSMTEYFGGIQLDQINEEQPHEKLVSLFLECFGQNIQVPQWGADEESTQRSLSEGEHIVYEPHKNQDHQMVIQDQQESSEPNQHENFYRENSQKVSQQCPTQGNQGLMAKHHQQVVFKPQIPRPSIGNNKKQQHNQDRSVAFISNSINTSANQSDYNENQKRPKLKRSSSIQNIQIYADTREDNHKHYAQFNYPLMPIDGGETPTMQFQSSLKHSRVGSIKGLSQSIKKLISKQKTSPATSVLEKSQQQLQSLQQQQTTSAMFSQTQVFNPKLIQSCEVKPLKAQYQLTQKFKIKNKAPQYDPNSETPRVQLTTDDQHHQPQPLRPGKAYGNSLANSILSLKALKSLNQQLNENNQSQKRLQTLKTIYQQSKKKSVQFISNGKDEEQAHKKYVEEFRTNIGDKSIRIVINVGSTNSGGRKESLESSTKKVPLNGRTLDVHHIAQPSNRSYWSNKSKSPQLISKQKTESIIQQGHSPQRIDNIAKFPARITTTSHNHSKLDITHTPTEEDYMIFKPDFKKIAVPGGSNHKRMISQQLFETPPILHQSANFNQGMIPKSKSPVLESQVQGVQPNYQSIQNIVDHRKLMMKAKQLRQNRQNIRSMQEVAQLLLNDSSTKTLSHLKQQELLFLKQMAGPTLSQQSQAYNQVLGPHHMSLMEPLKLDHSNIMQSQIQPHQKQIKSYLNFSLKKNNKEKNRVFLSKAISPMTISGWNQNQHKPILAQSVQSIVPISSTLDVNLRHEHSFEDQYLNQMIEDPFHKQHQQYLHQQDYVKASSRNGSAKKRFINISSSVQVMPSQKPQHMPPKVPPQIENSYRKQKVIQSSTSILSPKNSLTNNQVRKSRIGGVPKPPPHNNYQQHA